MFRRYPLGAWFNNLLQYRSSSIIHCSTSYVTEHCQTVLILCINAFLFTPQPLRAVWVLSGWVGGRREKVCPGCISETVRCRKLILGRDIGWGCRCATSWYDLDLTFDLAVVTLSLKILSGLYLINRKV